MKSVRCPVRHHKLEYWLHGGGEHYRLAIYKQKADGSSLIEQILPLTRHYINVFGEELIIENAEEALKIVSKKTKTEIIEYTAAPIFMEGKEKGGHEWLIEFRTPPDFLVVGPSFVLSLGAAILPPKIPT